MYKKNNKTRKNIIVIITIILIILGITLSINLNRTPGALESISKDISMFLNKTIMYPFKNFNAEKNIDQSKSYLIQKNINTSLEKEVEELKELLELNTTLTGYEVENATILSRNKSYWFNTLTIDKGKKSGLKKGMAVITKNGLIGKISKVSNNSSEIKLITSDDINFKISVAIKTNDEDNYAILNGYDHEKNLLKVTGIDKTTNINENDTVVTSGLGTKFPRGIYIGTVEEITSDKYNLSKTLYIKTSQDFNNIHYVTILKEKK